MSMTVREFEEIMVNDLDVYCENGPLCSGCTFFDADETHCINSTNYTLEDLIGWYKQLMTKCPKCCSIDEAEFYEMAAPLWGTDVETTNYEPPKNDLVNHPTHYTHGGIECIDAQIAAFGEEVVANFCLCNCMKYLWRHEHKGGKIDCDKALWYLNKYMELKYGNLEEN